MSGLVNVAFITDEVYARPTAVAIRSAVAASKPGSLSIHVVEVNVTPQTHSKLTSATKGLPAEIDFRAENLAMDEFPQLKRYGKATWLTTMLPDLVPELDRVLYLDGDIIVQRDLAELWEMDMQGMPVAAAVGIMETFSSQGWHMNEPTIAISSYKDLGFSGNEPHFNSGVMLCDLTEWRHSRVSDRVRDLVRTFGDEMHFADQEALNIVFANAWQRLDSTWNDLKFSGYDRKGDPRIEQHRSSAIIHFAGSPKPWNLDYGGPIGRAIFQRQDIPEVWIPREISSDDMGVLDLPPSLS